MKEEKKISLILGSHAHVPSGAPECEFEYVYENKMRPFVSNLNRYSNVQSVLHYSGVLLYWVERNHPEFFMLIEDMVSRKQIEILGGGFYEPCFPLIPVHDRIGQIELMTTYLRKHFGKRPQGCWIPGMTWEQHLVTAICACDMSYTFLSQEQFTQAGMKGLEVFTPCISEDQGKLITVFPVSSGIEKDLKEKSFSHVFIEFNKKVESQKNKVCAAAGVIVSIFPENVSSFSDETQDAKWNRFFEEISLSDKIIETILPSKIFKTNKKMNKASFQNSSAAPDYSPRNFLIKYNEINGIYSKMIFTNVLINQLKGDKTRKLNAREELWKAQDSCMFSPGNGHLRADLRKAAYSSLLRAEKLTRDKGKFITSVIQHDFDCDGIKEYLFQDAKINCYIQQKGAGIFELDYLPVEWNYLDCGSNESSRNITFADIILNTDVKTDDLYLSKDNGRMCFNEQYEAITQDKKGKLCFKLPAIGDDVRYGNIEINKCYILKGDHLTVSYLIRNTGSEIEKFQFIPEINLSFAGVGSEIVRFHTTDNGGKDVLLEKSLKSDNLKILDVKNEVQIIFTSEKIFSGSLRQVFNNNFYQTAEILPGFAVTLKSGETWSNEFTLKFSH
ncbi:MAG: DUF1926 domain-containing protein [Treponema sp.]|nr:DUF1926 domain-containing protein [Treponema sp.]